LDYPPGKGGRDGGWLFEMKEQVEPAAASLLATPRQAPAKRVLGGIRACLEAAPTLGGTVKLDRKSMLVRRLVPQEDKLDPGALGPETIEDIATHCGALLGAAHRRGARDLPRKLWNRSEQDTLLESAIGLAALHEAAWLGYFAMLA
jgi:hypothetical protein